MKTPVDMKIAVCLVALLSAVSIGRFALNQFQPITVESTKEIYGQNHEEKETHVDTEALPKIASSGRGGGAAITIGDVLRSNAQTRSSDRGTAYPAPEDTDEHQVVVRKALGEARPSIAGGSALSALHHRDSGKLTHRAVNRRASCQCVGNQSVAREYSQRPRALMPWCARYSNEHNRLTSHRRGGRLESYTAFVPRAEHDKEPTNPFLITLEGVRACA